MTCFVYYAFAVFVYFIGYYGFACELVWVLFAG